MPDRKKLDLRKPAPAPPPPPAPARPARPARTLDVGPGTFQPGQLLDPKYMTPFEREQLASIGWDEGQRVPGNAAELIAQAQAEAEAEGILPVPADTPPLTMPDPVDISRLPASRQRELREALAQHGRLQERLIAQERASAGMPPGVVEAMRVADDVAASSGQGQGVTVVDDRPTRPSRPAAAPAPTVIPPGPKPSGWQRPAPPPTAKPFAPPPPEPPEEEAPEPPPFVEPPVGELSDTGAMGITHCPHCSWELRRGDPSEPDDDDKRAYLMAALAGPGHRFARENALLGGSVRVGYRELTGAEADAALTQIADDVRKGRIVGDGEWWQKLMDYRMTQAIDYIEVKGVGRVFEGVDLEDIESDDGMPTPFPALVSHLLGSVLHSESLRRAIGQGFMRFQRLCEKLEANADEPSFWEGIGSLRLMVQAAAAGVVDFGRADPRDPKWWRYLRLIVDQLEQENLKDYHRLYNDRVVSILTRDDLSAEAATRLLEESDSRIDGITKVLFPWIELNRDTIRKEEAKQLRSSWESWFGKLDDPETQKRIEATAAWLLNVDRKTPGRGSR